jgi:hypothetical protein
MKRLTLIGLAVVLVLALCTGTVIASSSQPASKATAKVGQIAIIEEEGVWTTILEQDIKTPNGKDLFVDVSLECGLYTMTHVKSKGNGKDESTAESLITVQVLVDDNPAYPGEVVFASRTQTLKAWFAGLIEDTNGNGVLDVNDEVTEEELELILDTMSANSFNFILDDLESGVHTVKVQAMIETDTSAQEGSAEATATIGNGSVTIELVRMIKGEDIELTE